ncbi:VOC family protein [Oryzicola mucosus]|uniref:VOC family protein n=1 Tax=Oryzicola mucosus TaxID=2767425 RepID=A0A8J6PK14_9HYPH|nr:VOC family protein [Oryzicola mucosus]MBD0415728.1 VOC family protein [Oryzicola mucosus]
MIDHMGITATDFELSRRFYDAALEPLGLAGIMEVTPEESGGYHGIGYGKGKPFFWLSNDRRPGERSAVTGTGIHIAFAAESRAAVDAFYAAAMAHGGQDNGAPGLRPHYHPNYYGAFVIDPDGFNVEAVCHAPE